MIPYAAKGAVATMDTSSSRVDLRRGVYDADRAAALAGVPVSTLHYWVRKGIYQPSISPEPRTRYWSWMDLLALRMIHWLRQGDEKTGRRSVSMQRIRQALNELDSQGIPHEQYHHVVEVTRGGQVFIRSGHTLVLADPSRQQAWGEMLDLVRPYMRGPDLLRPREHLRIIPGKLHGEPHVLDTRVPSSTIFELAQSGYSSEAIRRMYPEVTDEALREAIDLERSLRKHAA